MSDTHSLSACSVQAASPKKSVGDSRLNDWIFGVLVDHRVSDNAIAAALYLRDEFNLQHGFASAPFRSIAKATGLSRGTTERAVRLLVAAGHLHMIAGGGGAHHSNIYRLRGASWRR